MKINVKDLIVGDVFSIDNASSAFDYTIVSYKVMEISDRPLYTLNFKKIYPIMCDCFCRATNKTCGYMKLPDDISEVDLIYRENKTKYESWTSVISEKLEENNEKTNTE